MNENANLSTMHCSLEIAPWTALPGGVIVGDWGNVDPESGDPHPMLLLRDRDEVSALVGHLWRALAESERATDVQPRSLDQGDWNQAVDRVRSAFGDDPRVVS